MITIQLLEDDDIIQSSDWCRPMVILPADSWSDTILFNDTYSGHPENNVTWLTAQQCCAAWIGNTVKEFNDALANCVVWHEFVRGPIPVHHQYGLTKAESRAAYKEYLKTTVSKYGKYKGFTWYHIRCVDESYYDWAVEKKIIKDEWD